MRELARRVPLGVVPVLAAVAILGYVAGHARSQSAGSEQSHTASTASVVLDYPAGWQRMEHARSIPGLELAHPIALAPEGDTDHAGLLAGTLPGGESSPLPGRFVASLRSLPQTQVVDLQEVQAYRYARLSIPGVDRAMTLFVIPNPHRDATALACYAEKAVSREMRACERIVSTLTLVGQSQSFDLTPEPSYARQVAKTVASLNRLRGQMRGELRPQASPAQVQALAERLAAAFAAARESLSALEPSFAVAQAQSLLSASVLQARDAYRALAAAASERSAADYASARQRVYEAESNVNWALESFALLGYGPSGAAGAGGASSSAGASA